MDSLEHTICPTLVYFAGCAMLPVGVGGGRKSRMPSEPQRIEVVLETLLDSVLLAEGICMRVACSAGFDVDDSEKICMAVREAVINAFRYGNQEAAR